MCTRTSTLALGIISLFAAVAVAQEDSRQEQRKPDSTNPDSESQPRGEMPKPLELATSNIRDLEKTGLLTVVGVVDRALDREGSTGLVWTIKTKKAITSRHLKAILQRFRDVRFYTEQKNGEVEVHSALLHYSHRVDSAATNGTLFGRDNEFELWFGLNDTVRRKLTQRKVDRVVFRRLKRS